MPYIFFVQFLCFTEMFEKKWAIRVLTMYLIMTLQGYQLTSCIPNRQLWADIRIVVLEEGIKDREKYIPWCLWDVITCPYPWYLLLAQHPACSLRDAWPILHYVSTFNVYRMRTDIWNYICHTWLTIMYCTYHDIVLDVCNGICLNMIYSWRIRFHLISIKMWAYC